MKKYPYWLCWDEKVVSFQVLCFCLMLCGANTKHCLFSWGSKCRMFISHWSSDDSSVDRYGKKKKSPGANVYVILLLKNYPGRNVFPSKIINMYRQIRFTFHIHVLITYWVPTLFWMDGVKRSSIGLSWWFCG